MQLRAVSEFRRFNRSTYDKQGGEGDKAGFNPELLKWKLSTVPYALGYPLVSWDQLSWLRPPSFLGNPAYWLQGQCEETE